MNNGKNADKQRRRGFALVVALGIVLIVSIASAGIFGLVRQEMHMARLTRDFLKARVIAEAGANAHYAQIRQNLTGFGEHPEVQFGEGEYQVTLTDMGDGWASLQSVGRSGLSEATVGLTLRNLAVVDALAADGSGGFAEDGSGGFAEDGVGDGSDSLPGVMLNAMTSGGAMTLGGTPTVNGGIASATSITKNGAAGTVSGSANAPAIDDKHGVIQGTKGNDPSAYTFSWNSFLNLQGYLAHAVTWDGRDIGTYPDNTILFVPGNISINGGTVKLSIIADGDINVAGQARIEQPDGLPTLVSRDGDVKLAGTSHTRGLVAALSSSGSIQMSGGGAEPVNLSGSGITAGTFAASGRWIINHGVVTLTPPIGDPDGHGSDGYGSDGHGWEGHGADGRRDHVVVIAWN